jgi:hypothetical protein
MIVEIPTRSDLDRYSLTVDLEGTEYRLLFAYNSRDGHWYLSVELADGTRLVSGTAIVADAPILPRWTWNASLPADGYLMAVDATGEGEEPTKYDLGDRIKLLWVPFEDVA